ncbi:Gfo/Idh/MocA family protein [Paenibacillus sp. GCM10012303]|uniref:Gfo/Idh/MocA family protein n=1 Tax=Paenibacillus sp. GCM10012303 TaxID=3317340 RepID=UPI00360A07A5
MKQKLNVGYVGCGVMGQVYLRAAQSIPFIHSAAVADAVEDSVKKAAETFGITAVYTDAEAMFADPNIDAVVLALPAIARTELAVQAFRAGKHVLTEKPVARNSDEVRRLIREKGSLIAGCASSRTRLLDSAAVVADTLAQGKLGTLRIMRCRWHTSAKPKPEVMPPLWRFSKDVNGGGNLANLGTYMLDYFLGINGWGLEPDTILARTWTIADSFADRVPAGSDGETLTSALISFKNGPVLMIEQGEHYVGDRIHECQLIGTDGTLTFSVVPSNSRVVLNQYADGGITEQVLWEGQESFNTAHRRVFADFAEAVLEGRQPSTSLEQALIVQNIIDGVYESAERGEAVRLDSSCYG